MFGLEVVTSAAVSAGNPARNRSTTAERDFQEQGRRLHYVLRTTSGEVGEVDPRSATPGQTGPTRSRTP